MKKTKRTPAKKSSTRKTASAKKVTTKRSPKKSAVKAKRASKATTKRASVKAKATKKSAVKKAPTKKKVVVKKAAKKPSVKQPAAKKAKTLTATDHVLKIIKRSKKGVNVPTLVKKTGFEDKKMRDIVYRTFKQGRIKRIGKGLYIGA
jgi:hypothetical protein